MELYLGYVEICQYMTPTTDQCIIIENHAIEFTRPAGKIHEIVFHNYLHPNVVWRIYMRNQLLPV